MAFRFVYRKLTSQSKVKYKNKKSWYIFRKQWTGGISCDKIEVEKTWRIHLLTVSPHRLTWAVTGPHKAIRTTVSRYFPASRFPVNLSESHAFEAFFHPAFRRCRLLFRSSLLRDKGAEKGGHAIKCMRDLPLQEVRKINLSTVLTCCPHKNRLFSRLPTFFSRLLHEWPMRFQGWDYQRLSISSSRRFCYKDLICSWCRNPR